MSDNNRSGRSRVSCKSTELKRYYPRESFREDYGITGVRLSVCPAVCLSVTTITKKTWTDLDEIFWEGS